MITFQTATRKYIFIKVKKNMSKNNTIKLFSICIAIILIMFTSGCAINAGTSHINNGHRTLHDDSSKVSIHPGETRQLGIVDTFGNPDTIIYKNEAEIWRYERTVDVVKSSGAYLTVYFNGDGILNYNSSSKSVKLIIYFNTNGVVKDYSLQFSDLQTDNNN